MAIDSFNLMIDDRRIDLDEGGEIRIREKYIAKLDTAETNPDLILNDPLVPLQFSQHPEWPFLYLQSITAEGSDKSRKLWYFKLQYNTSAAGSLADPNSQSPGGSFSPDRYDEKNPDVQQVKWSFGTEKKVLERGRLHKGMANYSDNREYGDDFEAVQNSAGQLFSPSLTYDYRYLVATVERNELKAPTALFDFINAINRTPFKLDGLTIKRRTARMMDIGVSEWKRFKQYDYRTISYRIAIKATEKGYIKGPIPADVPPQTYTKEYDVSPWDAVAIDQGHYELIRTTVRVKRDTDGNPAKDPSYLDGDGSFLDLEDLIGANPTADDIKDWIRYRRYMYLTEKDFSDLNFY